MSGSSVGAVGNNGSTASGNSSGSCSTQKFNERMEVFWKLTPFGSITGRKIAKKDDKKNERLNFLYDYYLNISKNSIIV